MKSKTGNSFYSFEKVNDDLTYFFSIYPSFIFSSNAYFGSFDGIGNLKTRKLNEIVPNPSVYEDLSSVTLGTKMFIYCLDQSRKESKISYTAINPDLSNYLPLKTIANVNTENSDFDSGFTSSPDGTMAMIYFLNRNEKSNESKNSVFSYVIFEEGGEVASGKVNLDFSKEYADDFKPYLTNEAEVLLSYTEYEKRRTKDKANLNKPLSFNVFNIEKDEFEQYKFDYSDNRILSSNVNISETNRFKLTGGYALANDNLLEGVFVFEIDLKSKLVEVEKFSKFNSRVNHKKQNKSNRIWRSNNAFIDDDWFSDNFELKNVIHTLENKIMFFEETYVFESQTMDSRGLVQSRPEYFCNDVLILVTNSEGEVVQSNVLFKNQRSFRKDDPLHSFGVSFDTDFIHMIFNAPLNNYDEQGNILPWSKKRKKSSRMSLMCATFPIDLSKTLVQAFKYEGSFARRNEVNIESFSKIGDETSIMMYNLTSPRNTISQGVLTFPDFSR